MSSPNSYVASLQHRGSYRLDFKLKVAQMAKNTGTIRGTAKQFGTTKSNVRRWTKDIERLCVVQEEKNVAAKCISGRVSTLG